MAPGVLRDDSIGPTPTPTSKPQSILSRKRTRNELGDADEQPHAPSKRLRVAFDPEVDIKFVDEHGEKSATVIREEVKQAIRQRNNGDSEQYDHIKKLFDAKPDAEDAASSTLLRKYLLGLINNAASLQRPCSDLVHAVLKTEWLARDDAFVTLYTRFLGHLSSSQAGYIPNVLRMLVANFAHMSSSAGRSLGNASTDRRKLQTRVHTALKYFLQLIPSASGSLASVLSASFPFSDDSKRAHVDYTRNLLRVTEYAPELRPGILDLITDRLIKIDVEVQTDVDDYDEDVEDLFTQGLETTKAKKLQLDDDDDDNQWSDDESEYSEDHDDPEEERITRLRNSVEKMDALLDLLFAYYTPSFNKGIQSEMQSVFDQLLVQFRKTILPTNRSRHTQFLLFHFAQNTPALSSHFTRVCTELLTDKSRSPVLRLSAAAYTASFIARGAHVSSEDVWFAFNTLAKYLETLRREHEPTCRGPDLRKYTAYYATAQALIYIFCFRWRDLLADPDDFDDEDEEALLDGGELAWASGVKDVFSQNIFSRLNPLKICAPEVVEVFEQVTRHLRFMAIFSVVDANKRLRLSQYMAAAASSTSRETSLSNLHGERLLQLDPYFPFDPYQLPRSKRWLEGDYNEWKGVPGMNIEEVVVDDDDSSVDDEQEEEDMDDERTETPVDSDRE